MTGRLLAAAGCVLLSLLTVWTVDPDSRNAGFLVTGALWGLAGVLVVGAIARALRSRSAADDHDRAAQ